MTKGKSILPGQFNSLLASHLPPKLLRERAETVERERSPLWPEELNKLSVATANEIIHELRVHQIELEMQNDSLHLAQELLAQSQARYVALYDLAPVAYCTVDSNGVILQANLTAASLLGVSRETLLQQSLSAFVVNEDEDNFYLFLCPQPCALTIDYKHRIDAVHKNAHETTYICMYQIAVGANMILTRPHAPQTRATAFVMRTGPPTPTTRSTAMEYSRSRTKHAIPLMRTAVGIRDGNNSQPQFDDRDLATMFHPSLGNLLYSRINPKYDRHAISKK